MEIVIAGVGRLRAGPELDLFNTYTHRLSWDVSLKEITFKKVLTTQDRVNEEGRRLFASLPPNIYKVALEEKGKKLSSEGFAVQISKWRESGVRKLAFLIGGADGHAPEVIAKANFVMSLGDMVWPHMLVRALIAEQLYRAHSILAGHPYHRS